MTLIIFALLFIQNIVLSYVVFHMCTLSKEPDQ